MADTPAPVFTGFKFETRRALHKGKLITNLAPVKVKFFSQEYLDKIKTSLQQPDKVYFDVLQHRVPGHVFWIVAITSPTHFNVIHGFENSELLKKFMEVILPSQAKYRTAEVPDVDISKFLIDNFSHIPTVRLTLTYLESLRVAPCTIKPPVFSWTKTAK